MFYIYFFILLALIASASAHMTFIDPCPRFGAKCIHQPATPPAGAQLDYNMISPIPADGILCKSNTPWPSPVATWTAGQSITVQFLNNNGAHGGGHAQFSVSYDGGNTFAVVYEVLKYMFFNGPSDSNTPEVLSYTFTLPAELPNSNSVVFAWSWVNAIGNREFYMNCADVAITGSSSSSYTGKQMVIANHNGYPTIPAFGDDYTTGLSYYENAPSVTVSGSGSSTNMSASASTNSPKANDDATIVNIETVTTPLDVPDKCVINTVPVTTPLVTPTISADAANESDTDTGGVGGDGVINIVTVTTPLVMPTISADAANESDTETGNVGGNGVISIGGSGDIGGSVAASPGSGNAGGGDNSGSGCTHGSMNCASGSSGYEVCVWGKIVSMPCGPGTTCKGTNGSIYCGWP